MLLENIILISWTFSTLLKSAGHPKSDPEFKESRKPYNTVGGVGTLIALVLAYGHLWSPAGI